MCDLYFHLQILFSLLDMFEIFFGWRKASKCKKLIKRIQCRLKLLKNKRHSIVRNLRKDMAQLIKDGHEDIAFNRVEQLIRDESMVSVYELLDHFCEFILVHLSYIRKHKDCPNDINEAITSLIFASARCGDLPELPAIRNLFRERYGHKFAMSAIELFPGNLVNLEVQEKLSQQSISVNEKHRLLNEIAKEYCHRPEILALEYHSQSQQEVLNTNGNQDADSDVEAYPDIAERSELQSSNAVIVSQRSISNRAIVHDTALEHKVAMVSGSSSESLSHFPEENVVYLDDVEEFQSSTKKDEDSQDQRIFKFKSSGVSNRGNERNSHDQSCVYNKFESRNEKSGIKSLSTISCNSYGKRSSRSSVAPEIQSLKDIECVSCYDRQTIKQQKKASTDPNKVMDLAVTSEEPKRRDYENRGRVYQIFTYPNHQANMAKQNEGKFDFSCRRKEMIPPYLKTVTMLPERTNNTLKEDFQRSNSCPFQYLSHVHPKLPDYDDITARFLALKKEKLQNKHH